MRAVADFAGTVAARAEEDDALPSAPRMVNVVPASRASTQYRRVGGGARQRRRPQGWSPSPTRRAVRPINFV